jgi:hypothetical protein
MPKQQDQEQQDERSQSDESSETMGAPDGTALETRPERLLIKDIAMKWILLCLLLCGCAGQRARITLTRIDGEPAISFEIEESKDRKQHAANKNK